MLESSWNVMAHGNAREGKRRKNWRMELVASTLYATSEHGVSSATTADADTSAASSRLNWRSRRFKWNRPFRRKTKSGLCACAITFRKQSTFPAHSITRGFPNFCRYYMSPYPSNMSSYCSLFSKFYDILYYLHYTQLILNFENVAWWRSIDRKMSSR